MSDGKPMLAVQQLLIKGLFKPETELATVQVRRSIWLRMLRVCMVLVSSFMMYHAALLRQAVLSYARIWLKARDQKLEILKAGQDRVPQANAPRATQR